MIQTGTSKVSERTILQERSSSEYDLWAAEAVYCFLFEHHNYPLSAKSVKFGFADFLLRLK